VPAAPPLSRTPITDWRPEDSEFWDAGGDRVARRNLVFSILTEHIGFSVWSLWSVLVLFLGPAYHVDAAGKFVLTAVPTAIGAAMRVPYSIAVVRFGGRTWTVISALLLLVPCALAATLITPGISYSTLMLLAALAGVGGGNFASSMTNINGFYPQRLKGWALGLNAGGGNLGVAVVQLGSRCSRGPGPATRGCWPGSTCRSSSSARWVPGCGWTTCPGPPTASRRCAPPAASRTRG
jgi:NNP family nitrate/nitrite transporter-like MFS transporter